MAHLTDYYDLRDAFKEALATNDRMVIDPVRIAQRVFDENTFGDELRRTSRATIRAAVEMYLGEATDAAAAYDDVLEEAQNFLDALGTFGASMFDVDTLRPADRAL
jgi:hypothetical protein